MRDVFADPEPVKPMNLGAARRTRFAGEAAVVAFVFLEALNDLRDEAECLCDGVCRHKFATAKRFLLGTHPDWREWRDWWCRLVGQVPDGLERQAREILVKRAEFQAKDAARKRVVA